jgi:predicted RecA/RadA family phage recombinase
MSYILTEQIDRLDLVADKDYKKGDLFIKGEIVAVAGFDVAEGELGTFYIKGLFLFDNVKSDDTAQIGDKAYYNGTEITTDDGGDNPNAYVGFFTKEKLDGETTGEIAIV